MAALLQPKCDLHELVGVHGCQAPKAHVEGVAPSVHGGEPVEWASGEHGGYAIVTKLAVDPLELHGFQLFECVDHHAIGVPHRFGDPSKHFKNQFIIGAEKVPYSQWW
uniref:Uncharacterized protein n=1 Tax=Oryza glaberrima TaxID=4538 RepID=I1Q9C4_ORYGL